MSKYIPSLNGLRAVSIFCVLTAHIEYKNFNVQHVIGGQIGVNIFFVISGFLITLLLLREEEETGTVSVRSFFYRRSLRIFPVFFSLLLVYLLLQAGGLVHIPLSAWLSSVTETRYFFIQDNNWETMHFWSLSVEEHFYLVWPLVFIFLKKARNIFALAVIIVAPVVRLATDEPLLHLFTRADGLIWGCVFAMNYEFILGIFSKRQGLILAVLGLTLACCLFSNRLIPVSDPDLRGHIANAFFGSIGTITNICIASIIVISINYKNNWYYSALNSKPINYLGKLSYSIYIWQQLFFVHSLGWMSRLPLNLICILIVAILSYHLIEKPFLKLKKHRTKDLSPAHGVPEITIPSLKVT